MSDLIFIHVPKTGGLSVTNFLRKGKKDDNAPRILRGKRPHSTAAEIREHVGAEVFDAATKFAVVREPQERYMSACRYLRLLPQRKGPVKLAEVETPTSFRENMFRTQESMLYIDGELAVDKLFHFEDDIDGAIYDWLIEQGFDPENQEKLPHANRTRRMMPYRIIDEEREQWIRDHYARDYELFGYS